MVVSGALAPHGCQPGFARAVTKGDQPTRSAALRMVCKGSLFEHGGFRCRPLLSRARANVGVQHVRAMTPITPPARIAFIGMGVMGAPMWRRRLPGRRGRRQRVYVES